MNDEFVAKFGVADGGLEGLKAEVRKNMERELKQAIKTRVKEQAIEGLVKENELLVPSALVDQEINVTTSASSPTFWW
ncbi:hypothetical protein ACT691_01035 [Vibrio metschnikovii]